MQLDELIGPDAIAPALRASSKKQMLQDLAARIADQQGLDQRDIFDALMERERLGSTGMGRGVAIPHARLPGVSKMVGYFARLEKSIDYDAADSAPVDLVVLLLAPEEAGADHLRVLAKLSRLLRDEVLCQKLRATSDPAALYSLIVGDSTPRAA